MSKKQGFTLIELLVVIAIIGILSGIVLTSLNTARGKAKIAAAHGTLAGIIPAATICMDEGSGNGGDLNTPTTPGTTLVCDAVTATWPELPDGWEYTLTDGTVSDDDFAFSATDQTTTISCTETGCPKP